MFITVLHRLFAPGSDRAAEAKQLKRDGYEPVLSGCHWLLQKCFEDSSDKQPSNCGSFCSTTSSPYATI